MNFPRYNFEYGTRLLTHYKVPPARFDKQWQNAACRVLPLFVEPNTNLLTKMCSSRTLPATADETVTQE